MLTLLNCLAGWAEGWIAAGRSEVTVSWERSPNGRSKSAAWIAVEGPSASGQLTVWESGEVAMEAMSASTGELLFSDYLTVSRDQELLAAVRRLVATCER